MNRSWHRIVPVIAVMATGLLLIVLGYQFFARIECAETGALALCRLLRSMVARAMVVAAAFGLIVTARPRAFAEFLQGAASHPTARRWAALHLVGMGLILLPLVVTGGQNLGGAFAASLLPWLAGLILASVGGVFWLAPPAVWGAWLRAERGLPLPLLAAAALLPDLADRLLPLWNWQAMTSATFSAVQLILSATGAQTFADPAAFVIGLEDFYIEVAQQCSGLEGIALMTAFTLFYALLFRADIRFGRFLPVVLPLALLASWSLNAVRIAVLLQIGAYWSPEVAVNGFHSYAGWLFFTLLSLGMIAAIQATPWLHRNGAIAIGPTLRDDWLAAQILPFVVFMVVSLIVTATSPVPDLGYPIKALALLGALWFFRPALRRINWRADPTAIGAGLAVGLGWVALQPPLDPALGIALAGLTPLAFAVWLTARVLGSVVLVPIVEELFFRSYLLGRLDFGGAWGRMAALIVSSALFGMLHGRWVEGGVAGLIFGLLFLRRGAISDAIAAHVAANLVVAIAAIAKNEWTGL